MHFLISSFGGKGDLFPILTLGSWLASRGNRVTVVTGPENQECVELVGLRFVSLPGAQGSTESQTDKNLLTTRYHNLYLRRYAIAWNTVLEREIKSCAGQDLVALTVDRPLVWADLLAKREFRMPTARLMIDLPLIPAKESEFERLPPGRIQANLANEVRLSWACRDPERDQRGSFTQITRVFQSARRYVPEVALWPQCVLSSSAGRSLNNLGFMPAPSLAPPYAHIADEALAAVGGKYLVFIIGTEGTTRQWAPSFIEASIAICRRLDLGGLFLGAGDPAIARLVPPGCIWRKFIPLDSVLPRACAIVHHGGVGTGAAAIRHGVPQLIVPRVGAQASNAEWLRRAGLAITMQPKEYLSACAGETIARLIGDGDYSAIAREIAARPGFAADPKSACEFFEHFPQASSQPRVTAKRPSPAARNKHC